MQYKNIIKKAYHFTKSHSLLWLFGLFFSFSINIGLLSFVSFNPFTVDSPLFQILMNYRAINIFVIVAIFLFWLAFNWTRVFFILYTSDLLNIERRRQTPKLEKHSLKILLKESKRYFVSVSLVNFFNFLACLAGYVIVNSYLETLTRSDSSILKITVPVVSYVVLAFFFNMVDIFAGFFIVLYRSKTFIAINLTLDFLLKKWKTMLKATSVFLFLYLISIILVSIITHIFVALSVVASSALIHSTATNSLLIGLVGIMGWFCAALFNIFFKTCFLLFFSEMVKPPLDPSVKEVQADLSALPAVAN